MIYMNNIINTYFTSPLNQFEIGNLLEIYEAFLHFFLSALNFCETIEWLEFFFIIGNVILIIGVILLAETAKHGQPLESKVESKEKTPEEKEKEVIDILSAKVPKNSIIYKWDRSLNAYVEYKTTQPGIFIFDFLRFNGSSITSMPIQHKDMSQAILEGTRYTGFYYRATKNTTLSIDNTSNNIQVSNRWWSNIRKDHVVHSRGTYLEREPAFGTVRVNAGLMSLNQED